MLGYIVGPFLKKTHNKVSLEFWITMCMATQNITCWRVDGVALTIIGVRHLLFKKLELIDSKEEGWVEMLGLKMVKLVLACWVKKTDILVYAFSYYNIVFVLFSTHEKCCLDQCEVKRKHSQKCRVSDHTGIKDRPRSLSMVWGKNTEGLYKLSHCPARELRTWETSLSE